MVPLPACEKTYSAHTGLNSLVIRNSQLESLPDDISFSPVHVPSEAVATPVVISKRDLFDARFQLIASTEEQDLTSTQEPQDLQFVEAPSDLIPGVYEGGLKTWECSVDLAGYLHDTLPSDSILEKRILEVSLHIIIIAEGSKICGTENVICSLDVARRYRP